MQVEVLGRNLKSLKENLVKIEMTVIEQPMKKKKKNALKQNLIGALKIDGNNVH